MPYKNSFLYKNKINISEKLNLSEFDYIDKDDFDNRFVIVYEKIRGIDIRVVYDSGLVKILDGFTSNELNEVYNFFNLKYVKNYSKIVQAFGNSIPFVMYGVYINPKKQSEIKYLPEDSEPNIIFSDIFINNNWVNNDDLEELITNNGLKYVPILYQGNFDIDNIEMISKQCSTYSQFNDQIMEGVVIKSYIEDADKKNNRLARILTNEHFIHTSLVSNEKIESEAKKLLRGYISGSTVSHWSTLLNKKKIELKKENLTLIMKTICNDALIDLQVDVQQLSLDEKLPFDDLLKSVKKFLPILVKENLNL
jgi:hypothetical protein